MGSVGMTFRRRLGLAALAVGVVATSLAVTLGAVALPEDGWLHGGAADGDAQQASSWPPKALYVPPSTLPQTRTAARIRAASTSTRSCMSSPAPWSCC